MWWTTDSSTGSNLPPNSTLQLEAFRTSAHVLQWPYSGLPAASSRLTCSRGRHYPPVKRACSCAQQQLSTDVGRFLTCHIIWQCD
jgi:hypothetical protein